MDAERGREWDIPYCVIYAVGVGDGLGGSSLYNCPRSKKDCSGFSAKSLL